MFNVLHSLLFRKGGRPRKLVRLVIFRSDGTVRPAFRRVVFKKNGWIRPEFSHWSTNLVGGKTGRVAGAAEAVSAPSDNLPGIEESKLRTLLPLSAMVQKWQKRMPMPTLLTDAAILEHLSKIGSGPVILAAGQDNYRTVPGGVQLCIQREAELASARGMTYLQFHPWQPLPCLADAADSADYPVTLVCDGLIIGTASINALINATALLVAKGRSAHLVIHHLLGHAPEAVARLAQATGGGRTLFWLHDFFSLCPSYTLQRNTLEFCGAPDVASNACGLCVFGAARRSHQDRIAEFFRMANVTVVSPSEVTAAFWVTKADLLYSEIKVVPHMTLLAEPRAVSKQVKGGTLTVGFLGAPVEHKGWLTFTKLMYEMEGDGLRFVVLSEKRPGLGEDHWRPVHVTSDDPDAMANAVAEAGIDLVLHWASWPETFSITTFEAMAGGAYVLTNLKAGNVSATVTATGRGAVLADQTALLDFFRDGSAARLAQERRVATASTDLRTRHSDLSFAVAGWV